MTKPTVDQLLEAAVAAVPGGEIRAGQQQMATAIAESMDTGVHLLAQAGTGTGKSLAYLTPALLADGPVVISTATLALQSQLIATDLPRLAEAVSEVLGKTDVRGLQRSTPLPMPRQDRRRRRGHPIRRRRRRRVARTPVTVG